MAFRMTDGNQKPGLVDRVGARIFEQAHAICLAGGSVQLGRDSLFLLADSSVRNPRRFVYL